MPKGVYPHTHIKPKVYPSEMVEQVRKLYGDGLTQPEVAAAMGTTTKVVYRLMVNHGIQTRRRVKRDQTGPRNSSWRGIDAGYQALHVRVEVARGKPQECSQCGTTAPGRYEWANLTGDYTVIDDYARMCVACHRVYDAARRAATGERTSPVRRSA